MHFNFLLACILNNFEILSYLCEKNVNLELRDNDGNTLLHRGRRLNEGLVELYWHYY